MPTLSDETKSQLDELIEAIESGAAVLFLGAGASKPSGGPLVRELVEKLTGAFPRVPTPMEPDMFRVCEAIIDEYDRTKMEDFIRRELETLPMKPFHADLIQLPWSAIFTTNYDLLIENAYKNVRRPRRCHPVYARVPNPQTNHLEWINLFKLMGCISRTGEAEGSPVLTRRDYVRRQRDYPQYYKLLSDYVKNGILIYCGYSFNDDVALDVIGEVRDTFTDDRLPKSYAIYHEPVTDESILKRLIRNKITPVYCGFEEFIKYVFSHFDGSNAQRPKPRLVEKVNVWGHVIEIPPDEYKLYSGQFEILTESKVSEPPGELNQFFRGDNESWGVFRQNWDFRRSIYANENYERSVNIPSYHHGSIASVKHTKLHGSIWALVQKEMEKLQPENNQIILIQGGAGLGKTVLLKRLGFDVYNSLHSPVILVDGSKGTLDYKRVDTFIKYLTDSLLEKAASQKEKLGAKALILIDDAGFAVRHLTHLRSYLTSRSRSALIVAAERKGEWEDARIFSSITISPEYVFTVNDRLLEEERSRLVQYVKKLGYQSIADEFLLKLLEDLDSSSFAAFYNLIDPTRPPLEKTIRDLYCALPIGSGEEKAYRFICLLSQFNLP